MQKHPHKIIHTHTSVDTHTHKSRNNFIQNLQNNGEYSYRIRKRSQKQTKTRSRTDGDLASLTLVFPLQAGR